MSVIEVGIVVVITALLGMCLVAAKADSDCLAKGYPESRLNVSLRIYCVARINQTDVIVPLAEAPRR